MTIQQLGPNSHSPDEFMLLSDLRIATGVRMRAKVRPDQSIDFLIQQPACQPQGCDLIRHSRDPAEATQWYLESCAIVALGRRLAKWSIQRDYAAGGAIR